MINKYKISKKSQIIKYRKLLLFPSMILAIISSLFLSFTYSSTNKIFQFSIYIIPEHRNIIIILYCISAFLLIVSVLLIQYFDKYYNNKQIEIYEYNKLSDKQKQIVIRQKKLKSIK